MVTAASSIRSSGATSGLGGSIGSSSLATANASLLVDPSSQQPIASPVTVMTVADGDSDFDTEPDAKNWRLELSGAQLEMLSKKEAKRQDVINGRLY